MSTIFDKYIESIKNTETILYNGVVSKVRGMLIESTGPQSVIGEICQIIIPTTGKSVTAEVIGLNGTTVQLMTFADTKELKLEAKLLLPVLF